MQANPTGGPVLGWIAYATASTAFTILALAPSILLFPQRSSDDYRIALLAIVVLALLYRSYAHPDERRTIVLWSAMGAGVTLATALALRSLPVDLRLEIPTPNVLPRLLDVDGELADDTFLYEAFNEVWLGLALLAIAVRLAWTRLGRVKR